MNGIENISPKEMNMIEITATQANAGSIFNREKAKAVIRIPTPTKYKGGFLPSILLISSISTPTIKSPFIAIKPPMNCSLKFHSDLKNTGCKVKSWKKQEANKVLRIIKARYNLSRYAERMTGFSSPFESTLAFFTAGNNFIRIMAASILVKPSTKKSK